MIGYNDFKKIDLRIGKIVEVEDHPDAEKLFVMKIDVGGEIKQSVAGLKPYFSKDELIGKSVVVVANLEASKLRGIESETMLLAAQHNDKVVLLVPEKEIPHGAKVL